MEDARDLSNLWWLLKERGVRLEGEESTAFRDVGVGGVRGVLASGWDDVHDTPIRVMAMRGKVNVAVMRHCFPTAEGGIAKGMTVVLVMDDEPSNHVRHHLAGVRSNILSWRAVRVARSQLQGVRIEKSKDLAKWARAQNMRRLLHGDPLCRTLGLVQGDVVSVLMPHDGRRAIKVVV